MFNLKNDWIQAKKINSDWYPLRCLIRLAQLTVSEFELGGKVLELSMKVPFWVEGEHSSQALKCNFGDQWEITSEIIFQFISEVISAIMASAMSSEIISELMSKMMFEVAIRQSYRRWKFGDDLWSHWWINISDIWTCAIKLTPCNNKRL